MADHLGPRREALRARRSERRRRTLSSGLVLAVVAALVAAGGVAFFAKNVIEDGSGAAPQPSPTERDPVTTTLLFGTKEKDESVGALWMTLVSYDRESKTGAVVYVPAHVAVEVPGRGLQGLGTSLASGGIPLLLVSTENLLGIEIDRYLELSDNDAELLFEATGPLSVDVPREVRVPAGPGRARLLLSDGLQRLNAAFLVKLLYIVGLDADDAELGLRHIAFWDALLDSFGDEPGNLGAALRSAGGALTESDVAPKDHAQLLTALAALDPVDRSIVPLPVQQVSVGGSELYAVDAAEVEQFVSQTLGVEGGDDDKVRVQVLNGNGVPGIGQEVAEKLVGAGFRVVLTGNARRLNYRRSLIITYDDSDRGLRTAEHARDLLGVGKIQVSVQDQGIVDLTIVVGKDFLQNP